MKRRIEVRLTSEGIRKAIEELKAYRSDLERMSKELVEALTDKGVEIAHTEIEQLGAYYTGELHESIVGYFSPSTGVGLIKTDCWYAMYVEYGTGIVGSGDPHPASNSWTYDINGHGEDGWYYYNERDNKVHWTQGMPSRPFMYNTWQELERVCMKVAKEVFERG